MLLTFRRYILPPSSGSKCMALFVKTQENERDIIGVGASFGPVVAVDRSSADGPFKGQGVRIKIPSATYVLERSIIQMLARKHRLHPQGVITQEQN
jgi:hypothetical protein